MDIAETITALPRVPKSGDTVSFNKAGKKVFGTFLFFQGYKEARVEVMGGQEIINENDLNIEFTGGRKNGGN